MTQYRIKLVQIFTFLLFAVFSITCIEQAHATNSNHMLEITFANDPTKSFMIGLESNGTQTILQNKIWNQDNFSRFNLNSYSMDGGPLTPIPRDNGTLSLQVSTTSDHHIIFYSTLQHPIYIAGTNIFKFLPTSITKDNWFDSNSSTTISVPYVIKSNQENVRKQLIGWTSGDSYTNVISRNESGFYTLSNINTNEFHKINFEYKNQYHVDVISNFGRTIGSGWYDDGSIITISVIPGNDFILKHDFIGWEGSIIGQGGQDTANVLVSSPKTIIAIWQEDYTVITIVGILIVAGITYSIIHHKRKNHS